MTFSEAAAASFIARGRWRTSNGHTLMQRIQLMHLAGSGFIGSPGSMAPVGHSCAQVPQPLHSLPETGWKGRPSYFC